MDEIAPKLRILLRWLAFGAAGLIAVLAIFLSTLPYVIGDRAVHAGLVRSLSAWSGGPVTIHGPVRVVSFSSLSIEARGVSFAATPRLSPIGRLETDIVTAALRLSSLLRGRIEFKKIEAASPRFVFERSALPPKQPFFGLETARAAIAFANLSRFEQLDLYGSSFFIPEGARRPYRRLDVERISLGKALPLEPLAPSAARGGKAAGFFTFRLMDRGFEAYFRGTMNQAEEAARGIFRLKVPDSHPASKKIIAAIAPWEEGHGVQLGGELSWSGARASLDGASVSFDDHSAKGSLALAVRRGRALLEGTLAYDQLNWGQSKQRGERNDASPLEPVRALVSALSDRARNLDLDMRISAERFGMGFDEPGPLALALTFRPDHLSIDIAELALYGGKITGRLDYDPAVPSVLSLDATGTRLNSRALASALGWPLSVSGSTNLRLAFEVPFETPPAALAAKTAAGSFAVTFPAGGSLDGDLAHHISAAFDQDAFWGLGSNSIAFTSARVEGTAEAGKVTLKINGETTKASLTGQVHVALPDNAVSGALSLQQAADDGGAPPPQGASGDSHVQAKITLSGTLASLNFLPPGKPHLSN
jgi:AsmA protein